MLALRTRGASLGRSFLPGWYDRRVAPLDHGEYNRWMKQVEHTFASAARDSQEGDFDWASFKAQQAAGYAWKGLLRGLGKPAFGHALRGLLEEVAREGWTLRDDLLEAA